jgi:hypothetical protein
MAEELVTGVLHAGKILRLNSLVLVINAGKTPALMSVTLQCTWW